MSYEPKGLQSAIGEIDRFAEETGWHDLSVPRLAQECDAQGGPGSEFLDEAANEMVSILDGYLIAMKGAV